MSGREALEAADNALLQDEHTSTHFNTTMHVPTGFLCTHTHSWLDFQVNILAMLLIPSPSPLLLLLKLRPVCFHLVFPTVGDTGGESQLHSNHYVSVCLDTLQTEVLIHVTQMVQLSPCRCTRSQMYHNVVHTSTIEGL